MVSSMVSLKPDELSTSVGKALALLGAFSEDHQCMGVSQLARAAGVPKSTAFRLLSILVDFGVVERVGTDYSVGPRIAQLASLVGDSKHQRIRDLALPYLQDLYEITHETVHLAVPQGTDVLYVDKIYGHNQVRTPSRVGATLSAGCSAVGKAIIAFRDAETVRAVLRDLRPHTRYTITAPNVFVEEILGIRERGIAFDHEEAALGLACVAAPVLDRDGLAIAAVSVCGPTDRFEPEGRMTAVRRAARGVARTLLATN